MERRRINWGSLAYNLRTKTRRNKLSRSSPNLSASSRTQFDDDFDNDDYGFITKPPPPVPAPPIPPIPLEFQDEYQQRLNEQRKKLYWENIKRQLIVYYSHHQQHHESKHIERMSRRRGSSEHINNLAMETTSVAPKQLSLIKRQKNKQNPRAKSVPAQSSFGLDDDWISERNRRESEYLDQVCEVQDCCESFEDFQEEGSKDTLSPLCVKCLVRYYNNRPSNTNNPTMSRKSGPSTFVLMQRTKATRRRHSAKYLHNVCDKPAIQ
ncbi:CLUMA_CG001623, isoform A [Clunio marinus]|uniref:CLUMA_CG001623, isoform A n=1 Tax=Clunio marinus TaxID=568069 RepID=A0A1J1HIU2_9DIPT|nr:CLUMA_CG001623, isoform A [Clunio marinus]